MPCTPAGVMDLLRQNEIPIAWRKAVVVGRSSLVGKPLGFMLLAADATVTLAHSRTDKLDEVCRQADLLVAAIGSPKFIKREWIKRGAVVVDVGINRTPAGLVGDVDYAPAAARASAITPVPGGAARTTTRPAPKRPFWS